MLAAIAIVPTWVIAGNIARMEALLFCASAWGFVLLASGREWKGLAVLAVSPLIHPNGIVFLAAGILSVATSRRWRRTRLKVSDGVAFIAVVLAYVGYSGLILRHRDAFLHDISYQLARKVSWSVVGALQVPRTLVLVFGLLAASVLSWLVWGRLRVSLWLAIASCAIPVLSGEMWYLVFGDLGLLLLLAEWLDIAAATEPAVARSVGPIASRGLHFIKIALLAAATAASLRLARWLDVTASPAEFPGSLRWGCMKMEAAPYVNQSERRIMTDAISQLARTEHAYRVGFDHPADGLLLQAEHPADYLPFFPIFSEEKQDLLVVHVTPRWQDCEPEQGARLEQSMKSRRLLFHYERDSDHQWYIF